MAVTFYRAVPWLLAVFSILFALTFLFVLPHFDWTHVTGGDAAQYHAGALSLLHHGTYSFDGGLHLAFEREPGMSIWLAIVYAIFGEGNGPALFTVQALLYAGAVILFAKELKLRTNDSTAIVCLALLFILPSAFRAIFSFNREGLSLILFLFFCAQFFMFERTKRWRDAAIAGIPLGFLMLTFAGYVLFPFFLLPLGWYLRLPIKKVLCIVAISYAVLAPWGLRNTYYQHRPCLVGCYRSALQWYVRGEWSEHLTGMDFGRCLRAEYITRDWSDVSPYCNFNAVWHSKWPEGFKGIPADGIIIRDSQQKILRNFPNYLQNSVWELIELHLPNSDYWGRGYNILTSLGSLTLYIGILFSLPTIFQRRREFALVFTIMGYTIGVLSLTYAMPRYLVPSIFTYVVLAAVGYERVVLYFLPSPRGRGLG